MPHPLRTAHPQNQRTLKTEEPVKVSQQKVDPSVCLPRRAQLPSHALKSFLSPAVEKTFFIVVYVE